MADMNRRNFLKSAVIATSSLPLLGWTSNKSTRELTELYTYLETKTIYTPMDGIVPFKLFPFQREILKHIHENNRIVIIKSRQIGMTTLLAGYYSWLSYKENVWDWYNPSTNSTITQYYNLTNRFNANPMVVSEEDVDMHLMYFDEFNFGRKSWPQIPTLTHNKKWIVCGTLDPNGRIVEFINDNPSWKVVTYPFDKCTSLLKFKYYETRMASAFDTDKFQREYYCKV